MNKKIKYNNQKILELVFEKAKIRPKSLAQKIIDQKRNLINFNEIFENKIDLNIMKKAILYMEFKKIELDGGNNVLLDLSQNYEDLKKGSNFILLDSEDLNRIKLLNCFLKIIGNKKNTKKLIIRNFKLTSKNYELISFLLKNCKSLKEFSIINCEMNYNDFLILKSNLVNLKNLSVLNLSQNEISFYSIKILKNLLDATDLKVLNLSYNNIGNKFILELTDILKQDESLRNLNLRGNKIGLEGVTNLIDFLNLNKSVLSLDLRDNLGFNKKFSLIILKFLKRNMILYKSHCKNLSRNYNNDILEVKKNDDSIKEKILKNNLDQKNLDDDNIKKNSLRNKKKIEKLLKNPEKPKKAKKIAHYIQNNINISFNKEKQKITSPIKSHSIDKKQLKFNKKPKTCKYCKNLEKKISKLETENQKLKLRLASTQRPNFFNSCSIINPVINESEEFNNSNFSDQKNEKEVVYTKIENLMLELTRLMDGLDHNIKDVTVDKEPHFSNSALLNNTLNLLSCVSNNNGLNFNMSTSQYNEGGGDLNEERAPNFNFSNINEVEYKEKKIKLEYKGDLILEEEEVLILGEEEKNTDERGPKFDFSNINEVEYREKRIKLEDKGELILEEEEGIILGKEEKNADDSDENLLNILK